MTTINNAIFVCHPVVTGDTKQVDLMRLEFSASFLALDIQEQIRALRNLAEVHVSTPNDGNATFVHAVANYLAEGLGTGQLDRASLSQGLEVEFAE